MGHRYLSEEDCATSRPKTTINYSYVKLIHFRVVVCLDYRQSILSIFALYECCCHVYHSSRAVLTL